MKARVRAVAYVQPKNHRPLRQPAQLHYRDNAELRSQIAMFAGSVWTTAGRIDVDLSTEEILVDGVPVANYAVHRPAVAGAEQLEVFGDAARR